MSSQTELPEKPRRRLYIPEQLDGFRNLMILIVAALTIEALAIAVYQNVHVNIERFSSFGGVIRGFTHSSITVFAIAGYIGLTTLRYAVAQLAADPLFHSDTGDPEDVPTRPRTTMGLFDATVNLLVMSVLFVAAQSLQEKNAGIEVAVWLLVVLVIDSVLCLTWSIVLSIVSPGALGFSDEQARDSRRWNRKWLVINVLEILIWSAFIATQHHGGEAVPTAILMVLVFCVLLLEFLGNSDFWALAVSGHHWRKRSRI